SEPGHVAITVAAMPGPAPKMPARLVPHALTAMASYFLDPRIWASRRRMSSKSPAASPPGGAGRLGRLEDAGGPGCGDLLGHAAGAGPRALSGDEASVSARLVRHLVQDGCDGQHQRGVLPGGDLDPVGVSDPEPLLGHLGHRGPAVLDGVLVVDDIALDVQVRAVRHLDGPPVAQRGDQRLLYRRDGVPARVLDLHRVPYPGHALLDLQQLPAVAIFEDQRLADPQGLAVDLEDPLALVVLDPVVVADGHQLLAHAVVHRAGAAAALLTAVLPPVPE